MGVQSLTGGDVWLTNLGRQRPDTSAWRGNCKICRHGIYRGKETAVWLTNPMGLSHTGCAKRAGKL